MPTFTRQDKFGSTKGYSRIRWGERSKVLETELTELQKIIQNQIETLGKHIYASGFLNKPALTYSSNTLTVPADTIVVDGVFLTFQDNMTLTNVGANQTVWLALWEQEVVHTDSIKRDGNQSGGANIADNGIFDYDVNIETSRRIQRQIQLTTSNADNTKKYIPVATTNASNVLTDTRVQCVVSLVLQASDVTSALGFTPVSQSYVDQQVALARTYA